MSPESLRRAGLRFTFVFLLTAACLVATPRTKVSAGSPDKRENAIFLRAQDGDSLMVRLMNASRDVVSVRLIGVDCPEKGQQWGERAKRFTRAFCNGAPLQLEYDQERMDRYGRTLAYVHTHKGMLNRQLVRNGLALSILVRPNRKHHESLKRAQREARAAKAGFWAQGGLDMTPWQWRRKHPRRQ
jgi:micrococcal nuclease